MNLHLITLYYAFFNNLVNYGIIAWEGAYDNVLKELESLQNRIIKIINKSKNHIFQDLRIKDNFKIDSVMFYYYNNSRKKFLDSKSVTRNKSLLMLEMNKSTKAVLHLKILK